MDTMCLCLTFYLRTIMHMHSSALNHVSLQVIHNTKQSELQSLG